MKYAESDTAYSLGQYSANACSQFVHLGLNSPHGSLDRSPLGKILDCSSILETQPSQFRLPRAKGKSRESRARRSVSRVLSRPPSFPGSGDGHSSGTSVAERLARPTRAAARKLARHGSRRACRSYLVLLPVGFSLPSLLLATRCALTAPFHPCRPWFPQGDITG